MLEIMKASAGSGKTYRLARKYITLLLESADKYAYRHILAVTFTNKATDEMKSRILKELHVLATDPASSGYHDHFIPSRFPSEVELSRKAREVLSDLLHDYSAFAVCTIDRFFQQTLKAFSREIGQFASYQVELDKDSLVAESVDRVLDSLTEADSGLLSWLTDNVLEQIEQGGRYSMDANLLEMAKRLKSVQRAEAMEKAGMDAEQEYSKEKLMSIRQACRRIIMDFRSEVQMKASAALEVLESAGVDPADSNRGFLKVLYTYSEMDDGDRIEAPSASFMTKAADHEQWFAKTKAAKLKPLVYPFLEAPLEDFCRLFDKEFKVYNTAVVINDQIYGLGVADELGKAFKELMREKNVLCIDDSNTILRDIIDGSDAPFVYEKTGTRYDHFLLDEFQDTAGVQWSNFSPLLHESDSKGGDNLIVGDVKQSIYRWRGSDWKLLNETVSDEFERHTEEVLDTNYRSLAYVVDFNNLFFRSASRILDRMNGYDTAGPMESIYSDVSQKVGRKSASRGSVSLTFCDNNKELDAVLDAVREAVCNGAQLSEIAVLVRSNATGESVAMHLIDNGIPVITDDSLRVKSSITVRRLVSLMSFADNPSDTVNGYLAGAFDIGLPEGNASLIDMAETLLKGLKAHDTDGVWQSESLHIQSFMDHLQEYVTSNGNRLRGFLKYWENENPSISSPSSGESVRVMTVHKSKGLDFPYVIIPFAENVKLFKAGNYWCSPDLSSTPLQGVADGVYDVTLSSSSEDTLFAEDFRKENFLQQVDNINILYVAMTRASLGMHVIARTPSAKFMKAIESGNVTEFTDFSQMLYWFASSSCGGDVPGNEELIPPFEVIRSAGDDGLERFDVGRMVAFRDHRKKRDDAEAVMVMEEEDFMTAGKGQLKLSLDAADFFSEDGEAGIAASNRNKGVVLHDILSRVEHADDLEKSVRQSLESGLLTPSQAHDAYVMLSERIAGKADLGWFPQQDATILNESTLIDCDGSMHRPDRVILCDAKVVIVDYKFGEHSRKYEIQLKRYSDIWRRMGYENVSAFLWYVHTDTVMEV